VFFEEIDGMLDFERKLIGLQFFTGNSGHENLRLETLILTQAGTASHIAGARKKISRPY